MPSQRLIGDVMTSVPHLIEAEAKVLTARSIMKRHQIRHLPVTRHGKLCGVISDRDIQLALSIAVHVIDENDIIVADVCSEDPYSVPPEELLDKVVEQMWERKIGSTVIENREKVIGIFTTTDACRVLCDTLRRGE